MTEPTPSWLQAYGLPAWQTVLDHDGDGYPTRDEFTFGTDPLDPESRPIRWVTDESGLHLELTVTAGIISDLRTSADMREWEPVMDRPEGSGLLRFTVDPDEFHRFYTFSVTDHLNSDGDCLLDFEELTLYGTDPFRADSDGDGINDCDEVTVYFTDPNFSSPAGRGAIQGRVVLDEDGDAATRDHPGVAGWTVFLDLDHDGVRDSSEPGVITGADGTYRLAELDPGMYRVRLEPRPGWLQVFPSLSPPSVPDGYADRIVRFFDSGTGPIPGPYGKKADPLPGLRVVLGLEPEPVEPEIILGAPPPPPLSAPISAFAHVDWLSLPQDSEVVVAFDGEEIFDGPGADLVIHTEGQQQEHAEVYLGSTEADLTLAGVISSDSSVPMDLASLTVPAPVRFVGIKALDLRGSFPGIEIMGVEALNYRPLPRGHYDVLVEGGMTQTGIDFGVHGDDRPPRVFIALSGERPRAGETMAVTVSASDDVELASVTLFQNGQPVALSADLGAVITPASGGLLELSATATDSVGQTTDTLLQVVVRNPDGSLPDLSGFGIPDAGGATGGPQIRITSPGAGEILDAPRVVMGVIHGTTSAVTRWRVEYAPADRVDPERLSEDDPDYVLLGEGNGPVSNDSLGVLAGDTLSSGAYLLRVSATDLNGTTAYHGFVIGVRMDPLDLRPLIEIAEPGQEAQITFLTDIVGSITTRQTLREWYVEYAPLSAVNLDNIADNAAGWTRIASGDQAITNGVIFRFDPTMLVNDTYVLRVSAWNQNGLGWAEPLVVHVTGEAKLGQFEVEYVDLDLPLAGVPIVIRRIYNSLNAGRSGEFGFGWRLALGDADIRETVPQTGSGFLSTPFRPGARVYLNAPDGQRIGFTFEPEVGTRSLLGPVWRAVFKPDPGVRHRLSVPEGDLPFLSVDETGRTSLFFIGIPWNPDTYILTDIEGRRFTYHQEDGLLEVQDPNGNRVVFGDDAIEHSGGARIDLGRDAAGRITQITAPGGRVWRYAYSESGDLVEVTPPGGVMARYQYSADRPHFLVEVDDPVNRAVRRVEYDASGRVAAVTDAAGNRVEQGWDPGSFSGTYTDARGNVTRLEYNARGNLIRRVDPLGGETVWEYENSAFPDSETAMIDPLGNRTTYNYDSRGNLTRISQPDRVRTDFQYDENDRVTAITHGTGGRELLEYDEKGRLVSYRSPVGDWTMQYTATGLLSAIQDEEGGLTRLEYDGGLSLPSRIILPDGAVRQFHHDALGRITNYTDPLGNTTVFEYDEQNRLVRQRLPSGGVLQITYDTVHVSQPAAVTDAEGRTTRYTYDAAGRITAIADYGGGITRYEYDADGNTTAVVDPVGNRTTFEYDAMSRLIRDTDPNGRSRHYAYDASGNLIEMRDRNGRRRTFVYNGMNRVTEERWHDPVTDAVVRTMTFAYDRISRLSEVSDPDATLRFGRLPVPDDRLTTVRMSYPGLPERLLSYSYDGAGRRTRLGLLGQMQVDYTRDVNGYLRILTGDPGTSDAWRLELWRDRAGAVSELRRFADRNGTMSAGSTALDYESCGCWLSGIRHFDATGQPLPDAAMSFTRDATGVITGLADGARSLGYEYDSALQLSRVTSGGVTVEEYAYDPNGNRLLSHIDSGYVHGTGNRMEGTARFALAYDAEGNLLSKSNRLTGELFSYTWDHRNRLTRVTRVSPSGNEVSTEFRYDGLDRRIAVIRNGQTTWTYCDGNQPLVDFMNSEEEPVTRFFSGERIDELYGVHRRGEGLHWVLTDHLGSVRRVLDESGVEVARIEYDAYGNIVSQTGSKPDAAGRFAFAAREWDEETGLYYNRARYYDPELGRFISEDPIGFASGDPNPFRYAMNQPVRITDPSGNRRAFRVCARSWCLSAGGDGAAAAGGDHGFEAQGRELLAGGRAVWSSEPRNGREWCASVGRIAKEALEFGHFRIPKAKGDSGPKPGGATNGVIPDVCFFGTWAAAHSGTLRASASQAAIQNNGVPKQWGLVPKQWGLVPIFRQTPAIPGVRAGRTENVENTDLTPLSWQARAERIS